MRSGESLEANKIISGKYFIFIFENKCIPITDQLGITEKFMNDKTEH